MISATLPGGLGNMLFVIAASSSLAWDNKQEAVYDLNDCVAAVHRQPEEYKSTIFRKLKLSTDSKNFPVFWYADLPYKPIPYEPPFKLYGYFQNEKYFKHNKEKIINLFEPTSKIINEINKKYGSLLKTSTVSMHVRRGDYLQLPDEHPVLSPDYYKEALQLLPKIDNILIFSDDPDWCNQNLKYKIKTTIIDDTDIISFYLMSKCKHNIIANSTFSWWAAWLNNNPNKRIIGPKKWLGPAVRNEDGSRKDDSDILPVSWIKI